MLDNLSKYVYEVYRSKSVSAAAKKLYLSQPALSASLKKAEKELGAAIFNRKTIPFTLTSEGKIYIDAIEKILSIENTAKSKIQDMCELKSGTLKIGTSTNLSYNVIPKICEIFRLKHPNIDISILLESTANLNLLLEKKAADLIFTPLDKELAGIKCDTLFDQKLLVAIRKDYHGISHLLPYALTYNEIINADYPCEKEVSDLSLFHGIEFIYCHPNSNIYKKRKLLFGNSDIDTHITSNNASQRLNYKLMLSGLGAFLTTDADIAAMPYTDKCIYFVLKGEKQHFSIAYCENEASPTVNIIREFIKIAKDLYSLENPLPLLTE